VTWRRVLLGAVAILVVIVALGGYLVLGSRSSSPVAEQAAVARYRAIQRTLRPAGRPATGVYVYAVTGWECAGVGPFCIHRSLPARAYAIVTRRGDLETVEIDLSKEHLEAQRVRVTPRGNLLVWQRTRISILGVTQDDAHAISPPTTLALPAPLQVGARWHQAFHDESLPVSIENRIIRERRLTLGDGSTVETYEVVSTSTTGGAHPGTERDVDLRSEPLGLDVQMHIERHINGVFPYRLEATATLVSTRPAR
jgi:hypothetical protein